MSAPVLIIGSAGQDGRLLAEQLAGQGRTVIACTRDSIGGPGLAPERPCLYDPQWVARLVGQIRPAEVYYLAALHHSAEETAGNDGTVFAAMLAVNTQGVVNVLEAIRRQSPATRLFYAASAHVFGCPTASPQDEDTPISPTTPYGISKAAGMFACRHYREAHGLFAVTGILYNHESILRPQRFLSAKIARAVAEIRAGIRQELVLGNLDAVADWGYAPNYTQAMQAMLSQDTARDFVIATGIAHTVREFAEIAFARAGLDYRDHVCTDPSLLQCNHGALVGDPARLQRATGWRPSITFEAMVHALVDYQLAALPTPIPS